LYYRVNVFEIRMPPLRERREDILLFARSFLKEFGSINGLTAIGLRRSGDPAGRRASSPVRTAGPERLGQLEDNANGGFEREPNT
jgi:hypothetical protein